MVEERVSLDTENTGTHCNEEPVRIQYKWLVPIHVFSEMKLRGLVISKKELKCSVSQFPHSCIYEQLMYFQDWSAYFAAAK